MNNQLHIKETTPSQWAAHYMKINEGSLDYYAWPQSFGSTSGPRGGQGGQCITRLTVEAFAIGRRAFLVCHGMGFITDDFKPLMEFPMIYKGSFFLGSQLPIGESE